MLRSCCVVAFLTEAKGTGSGGNITIAAPVILGLENSDISANAEQGQGGNIQITSEGAITTCAR
jgi:large exoprotein involved in heme utilization and adhesion